MTPNWDDPSHSGNGLNLSLAITRHGEAEYL